MNFNIINRFFRKEPEPPKTYHYEIIESAWVRYGACDEIMSQLALFEKSHWCWRFEDHRIWLIYLNALLEKGENEHAQKLLLLYYSYYETRDLHLYLRVATFAKESGLDNELISKAAKVYTVLQENEKNNVFRNYVTGKRIAVVGNGGYDLGKGKAQEIDAHDVIVRFNNYPSGYESEYGSKTHIWVRNGKHSIKDRPDTDNYDLIVWQPDFFRAQVRNNNLDILYRDVCNCPEKVVCMSSSIRDALQKESDILNPTSGAILLWMLHAADVNFDGVSIYGFSFPYEKVTTTGHYYNEPSSFGTSHNMYVECRFMRKLYYSNGGSNPPFDEKFIDIDSSNI